MSDNLEKVAARIAALDATIRAAHEIYFGLPADVPAAEREAARRAYFDPQIERSKLLEPFEHLYPRKGKRILS